MTEACFLARGANPLHHPATCEECYCNLVCLMFANFKAMKEAMRNAADKR